MEVLQRIRGNASGIDTARLESDDSLRDQGASKCFISHTQFTTRVCNLVRFIVTDKGDTKAKPPPSFLC